MRRAGLFTQVIFLFFMISLDYSDAALYIDDAYTNGKGRGEMDISLDYYKDTEKEYDPETEEYTKSIYKETYLSYYLSYGLTSSWDIGITIPYQFLDDSTQGKVNGFSDVYIDTKYRFWQESKFLPSFALYFDLKADSANNDKGLGTGKKEYTLNSIFTKSNGSNIFDANLGYIFVGDKAEDIFFYALDWTYEFNDKFSICNEIYGETTFRKDFDAHTFCVASSLSYEINEMLSLESGLGIGISKASPDYQFSSSITFNF